MEVYEKKQGFKELGSYRPAFLSMKLSFPFPKSRLPLYELSESDLSVFVHEYIHFLQDISSYCLLNNAYYYSEYLHTAVNYIYKIKGKYFEIPLWMPRNHCNVEANNFINQTCFGSNDEIGDLFITRIKTQSHPFPYRGVGLDCIDKRILVTAPYKEVHFGYLAIMESMAYLLESMISHPSSSPYDYPYKAAPMVVEHLYPEFGNDKQNVLALCDVSLQYSNPGNVFIGMLEQMKERHWLPTKPEDVDDYVYGQLVCVMGKNMPFYQALIEMSMMVESSVKSYVRDARMSPAYHDFVQNLLRYGLCLRLARSSFMLDIARGGYALYNMELIEIMNRVGMPIIEDSKHTYFTIPPYGKDYSDVLNIFPAIDQIHKCLSNGSTICEMIDFCEDSERQYEEGLLDGPAPIVTEDCLNSPWKHSTDKRLCPYAKLWRHWGLHLWQPLLHK